MLCTDSMKGSLDSMQLKPRVGMLLVHKLGAESMEDLTKRVKEVCVGRASGWHCQEDSQVFSRSSFRRLTSTRHMCHFA